MINGEIYVDSENPKTCFAYRGESGGYTLHYICVLSCNHVRRYGDGFSSGKLLLNGSCTPANDEEKARFTRVLADNDYHWNKANKKVIQISTGELL